VKYERQQRSLVYSMQSLHPNSRMADYSTFVECGDVAFYPPGATDEKHLQTWREYDKLHRGRADDPTYFGYWLVGGAGNELLTSGPHQGFIGSAEHVVHSRTDTLALQVVMAKGHRNAFKGGKRRQKCVGHYVPSQEAERQPEDD
jgi:hypothetical protein